MLLKNKILTIQEVKSRYQGRQGVELSRLRHLTTEGVCNLPNRCVLADNDLVVESAKSCFTDSFND